MKVIARNPAVVSGLAAFWLAGAAWAASPVEAGRTLANEACSACHQVAPGQAKPPLVADPDEGSKVRAPAFADIAHRCLAESDLRAKITSPHYPMREQVLTDVDVGALAAYIRSLAPGTACAVR